MKAMDMTAKAESTNMTDLTTKADSTAKSDSTVTGGFYTRRIQRFH